MSHPLLSRLLAKYELPDMTVSDLEDSEDTALRIIGLLMLDLLRTESNLQARLGYDVENLAAEIIKLANGERYTSLHSGNFATIMEYAAKRDALASLLDEALGFYAHSRRTGTQLAGDPKDWPGEKKKQIVEAMGFTPTGSDHQPDCPYAMDAGNRCNCVPPPIEYTPPRDVQVVLNDTLEDRQARAKQPRPIPAVER